MNKIFLNSKQRFSQRKGYVKTEELIQLDEMSDALRNSLWNVIITYWRSVDVSVYDESILDQFAYDIWQHYFKLHLDQINTSRGRHSVRAWNVVREFISEQFFCISGTKFMTF